MADGSPSRPELPPGGASTSPKPILKPRPSRAAGWQWGEEVLPFVSSLAVHLGLIALGILTYQAAFHVKPQGNVPETAVLAAEFTHVTEHENTTVCTIPRVLFQERGVAEATGIKVRNSTIDAALLSQPTAGDGDGIASVGGVSFFDPTLSRPAGGGSSDGGGGAPFGVPSTGTTRPQGDGVFTDGSGATKIVFVCDASGSMMLKLGVLKARLTETVAKLPPTTAFDVLFFQDSHDPITIRTTIWPWPPTW